MVRMLCLMLGLYWTNGTFSQENPRYNVLFIAIDDMNDRLDYLGWPEVATPNLQRLYNRGMTFTKAYNQYALCNPSRTSLLSGWRPDKTGIFNNTVRPRSVISPAVKFLPEYFRQYGYRTERYGKIMHGTFENDITWDYAEPPEIVPQRTPDGRFTEQEDIAPLAVDSPGVWWVRNQNDSLNPDGKEARNLVKRMQQPQQFPFFYGLGLISPHDYFIPNLPYWNMNGDPSVQEMLPMDINGRTSPTFTGNGSANIILPNANEPPDDRGDVPYVAFNSWQLEKPVDELKRTIHAYNADVSMMDAQLGLVLDELDRQNLWSTTIIVFFGDNGQHLGEHEGTWRKQTLFEESLHVPFVVCVPGKPAGVCNRLVELVDIYPTLIELCGLPPVPGTEASSFARLFDNPDQPWKRAVFSQVQRAGGLMGRSITSERYRYNSWSSFGEELYDHETDPGEYYNLATNPAYAGVLAEMRQIYAEGWTKSTPPPCDTLTFYPDADGDGFGTAVDSVRACYQPIGFVANNGDCNDTDATVNPSAQEVCDGIDNNCNGETDEGASSNTWYRDTDGDGFGDPNQTITSCTVPDGYVANNTDCDDSRATVYPGAPEICDYLDNNCNGETDENAVGIPWYRDADGDTYGNAADIIYACEAPQGYVTNNLDCNDASASVNPMATEICDGVDNNCNGQTDETTLIASSVAGTINCVGGTTTVTVSATGGSGAYTGTGTFTVGAGAYQFIVTDAYGCTAITSGTVAAGTGTIPAKPGSITGTNQYLCGGGDYTYSVPVVPGATSYTWGVPAGFTVVQNNGRSAVIRVPSRFTTGVISVSASNACGVSPPSSLTLYAAGLDPSSLISGLSTVAAGQKNVTYQLPKYTGATYTWSVPPGASITSGQGTYRIRVKFGSNSGNISVTVANACGSTPTGSKYISVTTFASIKDNVSTNASVSSAGVAPNP